MSIEGDAEFTAFVLDARPRLARVAYLMCGDWHHSEDLVQGVLTRLYIRWPKLCHNADPYAYARRSLVNALIDERRRPWRREIPSEFADHDHNSYTHDLVELNDRVLAALDRLPAKQRAVVVLRYIEDLPVRTVADELGIAEGTVKSQAARGIEELKRALRSNIADRDSGPTNPASRRKNV